MSTVEPIRKQRTVQAPREKAFRVFTEGMGSWWNPQYSIGGEPFTAVVVEPEEGGRWYERGQSGAECDWGRVLAWQPPERLVLAWQINAAWEHDPSVHTELEVRFVAEGSSATRVELEHRGLEALGEAAEMTRGIFDSPDGWAGLLDRYGDATG